MSHELFHDVTERRPRGNKAAGGTLAISILAHALILAAVIVVPLVATGTLPALPNHEDWKSYVDVIPPPVPAAPTVRRTQSATPSESRDLAPVEAHDGIEPEVERSPGPVCADCVVDPTGPPSSDIGEIGGTGPGVPQPPPPLPVPDKPIRLSAYEMPRKVFDVAPRYPEIAQKAGVDGTVIIEAVITVDGMVRDARVLKSVALLDRAALDAVKQWRYAPTRLNGVAVPVIVTVTVQFRLQR
jgi:periplasmic protein TonB